MLKFPNVDLWLNTFDLTSVILSMEARPQINNQGLCSESTGGEGKANLVVFV